MIRTILLGAVASTAFIGVAYAGEGDFLVRARAIIVAPTEDTSDILPAFEGGSVEVENAVVPELDFTYFVKDQWALELILATSPHDLEATGTLEGLGKVADTWVLPPTLTLQYHFRPDATVRPYAGIGLNYTIFYDESATASLEDAVGNTDIEVDDSFGVAFQAGVDVDINETWFVNADVKYIQIDTEATLRSSAGGTNEIEIDLDPIVAGIGIGRRF